MNLKDMTGRWLSRPQPRTVNSFTITVPAVWESLSDVADIIITTTRNEAIRCR